ncbi:MAG: NAD(P)H-hydrate epimerase [Phototrophicaceae bacterium]
MEYPIYKEHVPYISTEQMIEVDRAMIEDFHIELIQMMENAGRNLAHLARHRFLSSNPRGRHVIILAGTGGNGGGGLVCARRLHNYGTSVQVVITAANEQFTPIAAHQLDIVRRMGIAVSHNPPNSTPDLIIDAIIGYSLNGAPRSAAKTLIEWANQANAPILALDTPSGIDTTSGTVYQPSINATATLTLALPKIGLKNNAVAPHLGELYLGDISVPPELYKSDLLGLDIGTLFAENDIIRLK